MDIVIAVLFLAGAFTAGFTLRGFTDNYRMRVMLSITKRIFTDAPYAERLEQVADTWKNLRSLFYSWRGGLSPQQYFATVTLMAELDERLNFDDQRETEKENDEVA